MRGFVNTVIYLLIYGLFKGATRMSDYKESNNRVINA
jgi:hypothetical protein